MKLFQHYFSPKNYFKLILATLNTFDNIQELQEASDIIMIQFWAKLFQSGH